MSSFSPLTWQRLLRGILSSKPIHVLLSVSGYPWRGGNRRRDRRDRSQSKWGSNLIYDAVISERINTVVLYCIVLYCIVLYCIALYCIVLYCTCPGTTGGLRFTGTREVAQLVERRTRDPKEDRRFEPQEQEKKLIVFPSRCAQLPCTCVYARVRMITYAR